MTDAEKHEYCQKHGYPHAVLLPPSLYREAEKRGVDMRIYVEQKPMPSISANDEQ